MPQMQINGVNLYVEDTGTGEAIIFAHEFGAILEAGRHRSNILPMAIAVLPTMRVAIRRLMSLKTRAVRPAAFN